MLATATLNDGLISRISRPRYVSYHCNYQYMIYIDNVKIDVIEVPDRKKRKSAETGPKNEPRAILIAQTEKRATGRRIKII